MIIDNRSGGSRRLIVWRVPRLPAHSLAALPHHGNPKRSKFRARPIYQHHPSRPVLSPFLQQAESKGASEWERQAGGDSAKTHAKNSNAWCMLTTCSKQYIVLSRSCNFQCRTGRTTTPIYGAHNWFFMRHKPGRLRARNHSRPNGSLTSSDSILN